MILKWFKSHKLKKELLQRKVEEAHISDGGCFMCWPIEKHSQIIARFGWSGYSTLAYGYCRFSEKCPLTKSKSVEEVFMEIK